MEEHARRRIMRQDHSNLIQGSYDLLLLDEDVPEEYFTSDTSSIHTKAVEFVPELDRIEMELYLKNKKSSGQQMLYVSLNPLRLAIANEYSVDTCFLNNGINDIMDFDKSYEIPYTTATEPIIDKVSELIKAGKIRALGVSNFEPHHLEALLSYATVKPVINQVETHPRNSQTAVREFNAAHDILTQAWSPLAQGTLFDNPTLQQIAAAHHKSVAQVIFRWDLQHDILLLTKSAKASRLVDNAAIFDFTLSDDEMAQIDALNQDHRVGPHPDEYNFEL